MYILESSACTSASVLATILFIKKLMSVLCIVVPVILILMLTIDMAKAVIASDDNKMKSAQKLAVKRVVYAVIVFFVPLIVKTFFSFVEGGDVEKSCFSNATEYVVKSLADAEREKKYTADSEKLNYISELKAKQEEDAKKTKKVKIVKNKNSTSDDKTYPNKYIQAKKIAEAAGGGKNCSDGHKTNCPLGDQTGEEVDINKWRKGWTYILRAKDPAKANKAAACMKAAAKNDNIGYGQHGFSKYYMLWEYLKKRGDWDVSTVKKKVSVSCCPLVAVCLKYAGFKPSRELYCQPYPPGMKKAVYKAGEFTQVYPGKSQNLSNIRSGDILISKHHMAMAV